MTIAAHAVVERERAPAEARDSRKQSRGRSKEEARACLGGSRWVGLQLAGSFQERVTEGRANSGVTICLANCSRQALM